MITLTSNYEYFSKGSLIADHTVVLKKNSGGSQNNVIAASNNLLKGGGSINISGTPVGANHSVLEDKSGIKGWYNLWRCFFLSKIILKNSIW